MVQYCFICKWKADKEPRRSFHKFPSKESEIKTWLEIIGKSDVNVGKRTSVCSIHFEKSCFRYGLVNNREILQPNCVPSLYLSKTLAETFKTETDVSPNLSLPESSLQDCNDVTANINMDISTSSIVDKKDFPLDISCTIGMITPFQQLKNQLMEEKRKNSNLKRKIIRMRKHKDLSNSRIRELKKEVISLKKKNSDSRIENKLLRSTLEPLSKTVCSTLASKKKKVVHQKKIQILCRYYRKKCRLSSALLDHNYYSLQD